jgi:hypothetical protein
MRIYLRAGKNVRARLLFVDSSDGYFLCRIRLEYAPPSRRHPGEVLPVVGKMIAHEGVDFLLYEVT